MVKVMCKKRIVILAIILFVVTVSSAILIFSIKACKESLTYDEKVETFIKENPLLNQGQIVFIGDSITAKYKLNNHYKELNLKTYNRGISGDTTTWLLSRLQTSLFDIAPSKIVLMIGTNDINYGKSVQEIADSYKSILQLIQQKLPTAKTWCVSIIPQNTKYSKNALYNNAIICETNQKIQTLASFFGYEYVDLYSSLIDDNGFLNSRYSTDGLHINSQGYNVWTNIMKNLLI